jgi:hypothetical protein
MMIVVVEPLVDLFITRWPPPFSYRPVGDALLAKLTHTMYVAGSSAPPAAGRDAGQGFACIFGSHATVRQLITSHLKKKEKNYLRGVSSVTRAAVNQNVNTVQCAEHNPRFDKELAKVFPAATNLCVSMNHAGGLAKGLDASVLLEYIVGTSPALVTKLQMFSLSLGTIGSFEDVTPAVAGFLARYGQRHGPTRIGTHSAAACCNPAC